MRILVALLVSLFTYIVSFGLVLFFGFVALLAILGSVATLPSPGELASPRLPTPAPIVLPTSAWNYPPARVTPTVASAPSAATSASRGPGLGALVRVLTLGAAVLALGPTAVVALAVRHWFPRRPPVERPSTTTPGSVLGW